MLKESARLLHPAARDSRQVADAVILTPETADLIGCLISSPFLLVGVSTQDEAMVSWCQ